MKKSGQMPYPMEHDVVASFLESLEQGGCELDGKNTEDKSL